MGGLKAVMATDTVQGAVLLAVGAAIFVTVFAELRFDWSVLPELAPEDGFTVAPPPDDDFLPWPGIFTGAIWLSFYVWVTNHMVVQRVLAAKAGQPARPAAPPSVPQLPWISPPVGARVSPV